MLNLTPKRDQPGLDSSFLCTLKETKNTKNIVIFFSISSCATLNETFMLQFCPRHPKRDQASKIYTPKRDDEHPRLFHIGVLPSPGIESV